MNDSAKKPNPFASLIEADRLAREAKAQEPVSTVMDSREELARYDTSNLKSSDPRGPREQNTVIKAEKLTESLVLPDGESVRALCDKVDTLIDSDDTLAGPKLIDLRNYVQKLMITLRERPEFDSVLVDKDIRNVMQFIRSAREEALALREIKTEKKVTRQVNKERKAKAGIRDDLLAVAFSDALKNRSS